MKRRLSVLNPSELEILKCIRESIGPVHYVDVMDRLEIPAPIFCELISSLERKGFISKTTLLIANKALVPFVQDEEPDKFDAAMAHFRAIQGGSNE